MFDTKSQAIMARVAAFPARQCHGRGRRSDMADMMAIGPNSGCTEPEGMVRVDSEERMQKGEGKF
jgi:hypothetical protein